MSLPESFEQADRNSDVSFVTLDSDGKLPSRQLPSSLQAENSWRTNCDLIQHGDSWDGTAARASAARSGLTPSMVQKTIRMRARTKTREPNTILRTDSTSTTTSPSDCELSATTYYSGPLVASSSSASLETEANEQSMDLITTPVLCDLSNYLSTQPHGSEGDMTDPAMMLDQQSFRYASPMDDIYGWEAGLNHRKISPDPMLTSAGNSCEDLTLSYRRANGAKANLLQRVFRVGSSSSLGRYETSI